MRPGNPADISVCDLAAFKRTGLDFRKPKPYHFGVVTPTLFQYYERTLEYYHILINSLQRYLKKKYSPIISDKIVKYFHIFYFC